MKTETFFYTSEDGWSVGEFPQLDSDRTLVIIFGAPGFIKDQDPIQEIVHAYPNSQVVGCSSAGEIFGEKILDDSLSVAVAQFEHSNVATAIAPVPSADESYAAGESIGRELFSPSLRGVLILSDGINVNGSELANGINSTLPSSVVVTGGLAGDGDRFEQTWVIKDGELLGGFVVATGFYGDRISIGHGSRGGWDIFGVERVVTRSEGNVLYELDGKPALGLYKEYLGDRASGLPATALLFPLSLRSDTSSEKEIVRTILSVDEVNQSMTFAGDIPQGSFAKLMRANFDRLIDGASEAALLTRERCKSGRAVLSIAISCVGRRLVLGERTEEELEGMLEVLPSGTRQVGFYSYGEISPYGSGQCELHNQTMTLTTICEE